MINKYKQRAYLALKEYKINAERECDAVLRQAMADATYASLNADCVRLGFEIARLGANNQDTRALKSALKEKKDLRDARLKELGFAPEDLLPHYHCPICQDTGIVDGKDCACLNELIYAELRKGAPGIPTDSAAYDYAILESMPENISRKYATIYRLLSRYANEFPQNKCKILGLCGYVGSGKSYAVGVLSNMIMLKGYSVLYINAVQLNNLFLTYHTAPLNEKEGIFAPLLEADMLVIDDLGAETMLNNVTINYLYALISGRDNKHIAFTSNLSFDNIRDHYGARIASRLSDAENARIYVLDGKDLRIIHK